MKKKPILNPTLISLAILALGASQTAQAALSFSTAPAGTATKEPAPNVIVSVDNSGSMGTSGMTALKNALKATFDPSFIEDGRIRMAYQSMWTCSENSAIPHFNPNYDTSLNSSTADKYNTSCNGFVPMAPLSGSISDKTSHRGKFFTWIDTLVHKNGTPTHAMMRNAGEYLKVTGSNSAWNAIPGIADSKPIACRRAYHILMTDGGWNYFNDMPMFDGNFKNAQAEIHDQMLDNTDGTAKTLPDGVAYDPTSPESRIYADPWGRQGVDGAFKNVTTNTYTYTWKADNGVIYNDKNICKTNNIVNKKQKNCLEIKTLESSVTEKVLSWMDVVPTVADMAFHYWSTDLQPGLKNSDPKKNVVPIITKSGPETIPSGNKSQILSEYWNPKNNPATWRHMTTFTIGFNNAASWPAISTDPVFGTNTFDGDFAKLAVGDKKWQNPIQPPMNTSNSWYLEESKNVTPKYPEKISGSTIEIEDIRQQELWHIALNSRGKFYPAKTADDLKKAFGDILRNIVEDTSKPITSYAATSSSVVSTSAYLYRAGYDANKWKGQIESFTIAKSTGKGSHNTGWGDSKATTATKLDASTVTHNNRNIYTTNSDTGNGASFEWNNLHTSQQALLKKTGEKDDVMAKNRINFIRGDRSLEGDVTGKPFRERGSRHGDIVNSAIWYIAGPSAGLNLPGYGKFTTDNKARTPMLYVGANDGMLHGFSATDGSEKIAYIPQGLIKKLPALTEPGYTHQYYVDGSPFSGDVQDGSTWKTMLVGTLAAGGKGYFVLDITTPGNTTNLVYTDQTDSSDADLGHIFGAPVVAEFNTERALQISRMNNDRWALITGNGYNSTNGRPVLMIQYLSGSDKSIKKITAASTGSESTDNGLSTPRPVDLDGDGTIDAVYAGDLKGNMWKFDLSSKSDSNWGLAFSSANCTACTPFFTTKDASGSRQPITTAPIVRASKSTSGLMVAFGSGQNLTDGDRSDRSSVQTFYSMVDDTEYEFEASGSDKGKVKVKKDTTPTTVSGRSNLVARTFKSSGVAGQGDSLNHTFFEMSDKQAELQYTGDDKKRGWYFDFPVGGERVLAEPTFYDGSGILSILSEVPASGGNVAEESCSPPTMEGKKFQTFMSIEFGAAPSVQLLDVDGDGIYDSAANKDGGLSRWDPSYGKPLKTENGFKNVDGIQNPNSTNILPTPALTINWRQLQ